MLSNQDSNLNFSGPKPDVLPLHHWTKYTPMIIIVVQLGLEPRLF